MSARVTAEQNRLTFSLSLLGILEFTQASGLTDVDFVGKLSLMVAR